MLGLDCSLRVGVHLVVIVLIAEGEPPENTHYVIIKDQQFIDNPNHVANHPQMSYLTQIYQVQSPPDAYCWSWKTKSKPTFAV